MLVETDIPTRVWQFRAAMEADSVVTKRLYLVKCEYRAPFRAFLEAHQSVLRAPTLAVVDEYNLPKKNTRKRDTAKDELQALLETPDFVEALALEKRCEEYEVDMSKALFPFCELARFLEQKRARLKLVPDILTDETTLGDLTETLRRLKGLLCRKAGADTSAGIRPLLLDLQGVPRDEEIPLSAGTPPITADNGQLPPPVLDDMLARVDKLISELRILGQLCAVQRNAFLVQDRSYSKLDLPTSIVRGCNTENFDEELFKCQFEDWYNMVRRQHELTERTNFDDLAEKLRQAEMQMSLAVAAPAQLQVVRERVEMITGDRTKRFEVCKEMIEEVCVREMNLFVDVKAPNQTQPLALQSTTATSGLGEFGLPLLMAGETLPIG